MLDQSTCRPLVGDVRRLWNDWQNKRACQCSLIVQHGDGDTASVCGVIGDAPSVWDPIDLGQIGRLAASALEEPDRHSASKLPTQMLPETTGPLPGLRNSGMLSTHQLGEGVCTRVGLGAISTRVEMAEDALRIY